MDLVWSRRELAPLPRKASSGERTDSSIQSLDGFRSWREAEETVRRLNILNNRIKSFLHPAWLHSTEIEDLRSKLRKNKSFPAIQRKLIMLRSLPSEVYSCPCIYQITPPSIEEAFPFNFPDIHVEEISAFRTLQNLSFEVMLKMVSAISSDIPLRTKEVGAISHQLNKRFVHPWAALEKRQISAFLPGHQHALR